MAAHRSAPRRALFALLAALMLTAGITTAAAGFPASRPLEQSPADADVALHAAAQSPSQPSGVQRGAPSGVSPQALGVAVPQLRLPVRPPVGSTDLFRFRQFNPWIDERGPPASS